MSFYQINGRRHADDYKRLEAANQLLTKRQRTEELDKQLLRAQENAMSTYENLSDETKDKQKKYHENKSAAIARIADIEKKIADQLNSPLEEFKAKFLSAVQKGGLRKAMDVFHKEIEANKWLSRACQEAEDILSSDDGELKEALRLIEEAFDGELTKTSLKYKILASFKEEGVDKAFERFESDLNSFKDFSDEHYQKIVEFTTMKSNFVSLYNKLMFSLADKYPRFVLSEKFPIEGFTVGDYEVLKRSQFKTDGSNKAGIISVEELRQKVLPRLKSAGITSNEIFVNHYMKFFPDCVNMLTNSDDVRFAISLDPSCYSKLRGGPLKSNLAHNPELYNSLLVSAPSVLQYLSPEELDTATNYCGLKVGQVLFQNPDLIQALPSNFFLKHNPKTLFRTCPKSELKKVFADVDSPELQSYLSSIILRPKKPKQETDGFEETNSDLTI